MVRLRDLRLFRRRDRQALLPERRRRRPVALRLRGVRGGISGAADRWRADRTYRRSPRPPRRAGRVGDRHGGADFSDRRPSGIRHARPHGSHHPCAAAHDPGAVGRRRIHQLDGVPGRTGAARTARIDGRHHGLRHHRRHSARIGRWRAGGRADDCGGAQCMGLAHPVRSRDRRRIRRLPAAAPCGGRRAVGKPRAQPRHRDVAGSLAAGGAARRDVGVQRGGFLRPVRLCGKLDSDRRRHRTGARARHQHPQHDRPAAGSPGIRMAVGPLRPQAGPHLRYVADDRDRAAVVLGDVPPLGRLDPVRTDRLRRADRPLWWHAAGPHGRSLARTHSLHGRRARLQLRPRGIRRSEPAGGDLAGRAHRGPACARLPDHGGRSESRWSPPGACRRRIGCP